jgi:hypothetical protein
MLKTLIGLCGNKQLCARSAVFLSAVGKWEIVSQQSPQDSMVNSLYFANENDTSLYGLTKSQLKRELWNWPQGFSRDVPQFWTTALQQYILNLHYNNIVIYDVNTVDTRNMLRMLNAPLIYVTDKDPVSEQIVDNLMPDYIVNGASSLLSKTEELKYGKFLRTPTLN